MVNNERIRFDFIIEAVHDTQEWIKFMDTKAALLALFLTSVSFIFMERILDNYSDIASYILGLSGGTYIYGLLLFVLICLPIIILSLIFCILNPRINPNKNVRNKEINTLNIFFLSNIDKDNKLAKSLDDYYHDLMDIGYSKIISELSYEFLKLSYIRAKKEQLMRISNWLVFADLILIVLLYTIIYVKIL